MKEKSLVTIITPTYNRGSLISRAIKSVLDQSYVHFEYLIIDDASTDNTEEVVKKFKDPRIRYIQYEKNRGNAVARNIGVKAAKGELIAFLDSDDEYLPRYLEKAVKTLSAEKEASFLWAGTRTVGVDKTEKERIWVPSGANHPDQFLYELFVGIGRGFLIKKECFDKIKFDENLRTAVDTDFLIRLKQNFNFTILKEILLNIHTQPGSVRANYREKKKSYKIIIEKHKSKIDGDKFLRSKFYYKLFWLSLYDGDTKLALQAYRKLPFAKFKPSFLWLIFKLYDREKAIGLHKKISTL